ncbi:MAG: sugar ABC transporter ATP-binding protein [Clostridiales Family XIII bacterium]|jgi:ribose transport system ATP-binding protein|nr:sugar ABC transporter ATP-binding protein [Clostridiales Family XIII bacterium]
MGDGMSVTEQSAVSAVPALQARGICKSFGGVQVLRDVDLDIDYGEVHALMGENGAGKSTIIKIITGVYTKEAGEIRIDGKPVRIQTRQDARVHGISVIYQELSLVPELTVAENIFLGQERMGRFLPDRKAMRDRVRGLIDQYGFDMEPDAVVSTMGMASRQMVEILKALSMEAKLIIMDEPTSALSTAETERLFETIGTLRRKGAGILYISHRLEEVYRLADRLTVMRDGIIAGVLTHDEITPETVTAMMIGRELRKVAKAGAGSGARQAGEGHCLEVSGLSFQGILRGVDMKAYGGEILGIGGLVGSGRTELIKCIYGALRQNAGTITLDGRPISKSIRRNIALGFGFVPEDRRLEGFFPVLPVAENLVIASYDRLTKAGIIHAKQESAFTKEAIQSYDIRPARADIPVGNLSGGNQQKVVLGRWLSRMPSVLLLDEPTAGVDVGVKAELYRLMRDLAGQGAIIIMVSSDLEEIVNVSDRILVLYGGRFFKEFTADEATQNAVLLASSGIDTQEGKSL